MSGSVSAAKEPSLFAHCSQFLQQCRLRRVDLQLRRREIEELGPIDFGKLLQFARARRPFECKGVAFELRRITIAGAGPGVYDFAPFLLDRLEWDEGAGGLQAGLFFEFAARDREQVFVVIGLALGDRPASGVFVAKERPAGMNQQHFDVVVSNAIEQNSRADLGHDKIIAAINGRAEP